MEKQIELEAIKQQLEYTLDEVHKRISDKNLMHDWLTDALSRVKKLTMPRVIKSVCDHKAPRRIIFGEHRCSKCGMLIGHN
jgi:hypothetical protein